MVISRTLTSRTRAAVLSFVALVFVLPAAAFSQTQTDYSLTLLSHISDFEAFGQNGLGVSVNSAIGDMGVGDTTAPNFGRRAVVKFNLAPLAGKTLAAARLKLTILQSRRNDAGTGAASETCLTEIDREAPFLNPGLGNVNVVHIADYGTPDPTDYHSPSLGNDPGMLISVENPAVPGVLFVDVTNAMLQAIKLGAESVAFRIQAAIETDGDGCNDVFFFGASELSASDSRPVIQYAVAPDGDGDGIADAQDNCPFEFNPDQANSDTDAIGDACDSCPLVANQGDGNENGRDDACDMTTNEDLENAAGSAGTEDNPAAPGAPLWVTATFFNAGPEITTIKPDCVNTTFTVLGPTNQPLPPTYRHKAYVLPRDIVTIPAQSPFSVTCDLSEMFPPSILTDANPGDGDSVAYDVFATYANDITDPPEFTLWLGVATSPALTVYVKGQPVERQQTQQITFDPSQWVTVWGSLTGGSAIMATIKVPNAENISPTSIRLNGSVSIEPNSFFKVSSDTVTVLFNRAQAVLSLGTARPGVVFPTIQGTFSGSSSIFSGQGLVTLVDAIPVVIDIKPGSPENTVNLGSNGVIPVAILSSATFTATNVDPATVTLAGAAAKLKGKGTPIFTIQDVNGDGRKDVIVNVTTEALQLTTTATQATLMGKLFDGQPITGSDSVKIVP